MGEPIISPDGKFMWTGNEWIPLPDNDEEDYPSHRTEYIPLPFENLKIPRGRSLTFFDVETTGLSVVHGDRVCEFAFIHYYEGGRIEHSKLICPRDRLAIQRSVAPGAFSTHGISDQTLEFEEAFEENADIIESLQSIFENTILVAHNAKFDLEFIVMEFNRCNLEIPPLTVIDTLQVARKCMKAENYKLGNLSKLIGFEGEKFHRALADVKALEHLFRHLVSQISDGNDITIEDMMLYQKSSEYNFSRKNSLNGIVEFFKFDGASTNAIRNRDSNIDYMSIISSAETHTKISNRLHSHWLIGDYRNQVAIEYMNKQDISSSRIVTPTGIFYNKGIWFFDGYCHERKQIRTFRFDRLVSAKNSTENNLEVESYHVWGQKSFNGLFILNCLLCGCIPEDPVENQEPYFESKNFIMQTIAMARSLNEKHREAELWSILGEITAMHSMLDVARTYFWKSAMIYHSLNRGMPERLLELGFITPNFGDKTP